MRQTRGGTGKALSTRCSHEGGPAAEAGQEGGAEEIGAKDMGAASIWGEKE